MKKTLVEASDFLSLVIKGQVSYTVILLLCLQKWREKERKKACLLSNLFYERMGQCYENQILLQEYVYDSWMLACCSQSQNLIGRILLIFSSLELNTSQWYMEVGKNQQRQKSIKRHFVYCNHPFQKINHGVLKARVCIDLRLRNNIGL